MVRPSRKSALSLISMSKLRAGLPHRRLRSVDERRIGDAVVDERADQRSEAPAQVLVRLDSLREPGLQLVEVSDQGEGEV